MSKFIHTVPTGVTNSVFGTAGSIIGVAELIKTNGATTTAADFDNAGMIASGVAFAQVPDAAVPQVGAVLGTALAAGTGNAAFDTVNGLESGMTFPPAESLVYNGTVWTRLGGFSGGSVATFTIETAGTGYTTGSGKATFVTLEVNADGPRTVSPLGLTVNITAVNGTGGITAAAVTAGGHLFHVGDQVSVTDGANNAILQVATITYPQIGTFNTARPTANPNRLSPSYFPTHPPGLTGQNIHLKQPTTGARVFYDDTLSGNFRFSSGTTDIFDGSDFTLQVKTGDLLLGTLTMPAASNSNANVNFNAAS